MHPSDSEATRLVRERSPDRVQTKGALDRFLQRWQTRAGDERQEGQSFLRDLVAAYGGSFDALNQPFERRVRVRGRTGFADLVIDGVALVEMKSSSKTATLDGADHVKQLWDYWRGLGEVGSAPHYLVLCSFDRFIVFEPARHAETPVADFALTELPSHPEWLDFLRDRAPAFDRGTVDLAIDAVAAVTELYHRLVRVTEPTTARRFVLQATWCMFAEDLGLFREQAFSELTELVQSNPEMLQLDPFGSFFTALNDETRSGVGVFQSLPHVNGGLFAQPARVPLDVDDVELLAKACAAPWHEVEPSVFGGLLQSGIDRERREDLGAHYTPESKIKLLVQPVIVEPWIRRIDAVTTPAEGIALLHELTRFTVLDPACGCGNFLYVAYGELRGLERSLRDRISALAAEAGMPDPTGDAEPLPHVLLAQVRGIEIDEFAADLARVVLWIGHAVAITKHGFALTEPRLPLPEITEIRTGDSLELDWGGFDAIVGNPPFIGSQRLRARLGDERVERLRKQHKFLGDYCVYWFRKAHDGLRPGQRAGLVATNSIREGRAREKALDYIVENGGVITDAVSSTVWDGEANVHVSLVSWQKTGEGDAPAEFFLDGQPVEGITPSLTPGLALSPPAKLPGNRGRAFQGPIPVGKGFELSTEEAHELLGRPEAHYADVVVPFLKGQDIAQSPGQRPRQWIIDFADWPLERAAKYPAALEIVRDRVKPDRGSNNRKLYRERWWNFGELRVGLRAALVGLDRYLVCNEYGKAIQFAWQPAGVIPNNKTFAFATADAAVAGVLASGVHEAWRFRWGGSLKADHHYTVGGVMETFGFPDLDARDAISPLGEALFALRHDLTVQEGIGLTKLYNLVADGMYRELADLHRTLDGAVVKAYGWSSRLLADRDALVAKLYERNRRLMSDPGAYEAFPLRGQTVLTPGMLDFGE